MTMRYIHIDIPAWMQSFHILGGVGGSPEIVLVRRGIYAWEVGEEEELIEEILEDQ